MIALFCFIGALMLIATVMSACDFFPDKDEDMS